VKKKQHFESAGAGAAEYTCTSSHSSYSMSLRGPAAAASMASYGMTAVQTAAADRLQQARTLAGYQAQRSQFEQHTSLQQIGQQQQRRGRQLFSDAAHESPPAAAAADAMQDLVPHSPAPAAAAAAAAAAGAVATRAPSAPPNPQYLRDASDSSMHELDMCGLTSQLMPPDTRMQPSPLQQNLAPPRDLAQPFTSVYMQCVAVWRTSKLVLPCTSAGSCVCVSMLIFVLCVCVCVLSV